jgi:hypothetical protein
MPLLSDIMRRAKTALKLRGRGGDGGIDVQVDAIAVYGQLD